MNPAQAIQIALLLPLAGAALALVLRRKPRALGASGPLVAAATTAVLASQLSGVQAGARPSFNLVQVFPGVWLGFRLEPLGLLFALIVAGLWIPASAHSAGYLRARGERAAARVLGCSALAVAMALGVALARNLLTLFVFLQLLCLACYPLIAHSGDERARRAGRVFLGTLLGASGSLLFLALVWTFHLCGTLEFRPDGILAGRADEFDASALLALFAFGLGPLALVPGHRWLVAALAAPAPGGFPIAAVLAQAGAFAFLKVAVHVFGPELLAQVDAARWLCWAAAVTVLWAAAQAWRARELKLLIAYAVLGQLGSLVLGTLLAPAAAAAGGGLHLAAHAAGALALFLAAGSLELAAGRTEVRELAGLGRSMPIICVAFALGALALATLAPLGAWSEWRRVAEPAPWFAVIGIGALATAAALLAIPARAFFARAPSAANPVDPSRIDPREAPAVLVLSLCATLLAGSVLYLLAAQVSGL